MLINNHLLYEYNLENLDQISDVYTGFPLVLIYEIASIPGTFRICASYLDILIS